MKTRTILNKLNHVKEPKESSEIEESVQYMRQIDYSMTGDRQEFIPVPTPPEIRTRRLNYEDIVKAKAIQQHEEQLDQYKNHAPRYGHSGGCSE